MMGKTKCLRAMRRFEERGGNLLFRAEFSRAGRGNNFRNGVVMQQRYVLEFVQLREAAGEPLGEALTEAILQGLWRVVERKE